MNFHDLDNFNLADAVKFHNRLNPRIWGSDEHLLPEVREKLQAIAADFQEFLGVDDLKVQDITISGSNAAYSYTPHSDIDLHLVVDMPDDPVYQELFAAKKYQYNDEHSIRIGGIPVELYVQPADQKHVSQGIYSVKNGDWLQVPQRRRARIDDSCVQHKTADLDARIHSAVKSGDADAINRLWDKIKAMRQAGLEQNGEFGCENIAFKLLRNMGCIGRLKDAKNALRDRELSLTAKPRERKRMNYGMRDYWFPGTAYAGQDHPAGTESEQVDESADPDQLKKILHRFYRSCVDKLQLKNPPQLRLETTPDWSRENGSFGQYESETNTLILATSGRHVLDILRTMAHEMTHRQQDELNPLPIDAGETGSPWEDQANAMAGRIMRQWAEEQPEMFDGVTLEEASGYIPTKKQAKDPRFVMALTRDVRPGAVGKEANKLGLETDSQGHPALLTAGLQKMLREFKEQDLFEINMGGKNLRREAAKTGALAGMEFEMIVPNTESGDNEEMEPDFDSDERASSTRDIRDFFYDSDYNSRRDVERLLDRMMDDYNNWQVEQFDTRWDSDAETFIYDYLKENVDEDSIRELFGLEPEDDLGKKEYQLAADKIATEQLEPFYSDALELSRDEFYENDNFEEWLGDAGLTHMSDIYHRYDTIIHWPHYTSSLAGGVSVEDVADSFSQAVGRPVKASSGYHSSSVERPAPGKNFYIVEPDGSLEPDGPEDSGLEFVSPPLPIDDIMSDLKKVKKWADQTGCYTNDSTGLHINISVPDYDLDKLDFVKLALLMGDEYVLQQFGRVGNTYAKSAMGKVRDHVQKRPYEAKYLLDKMKGHMGALASKAIHSGSTEKYTSINTKDGHVEFRSPGGDWLDDNFDKIENTLMRFTVALSAAMNPAAYREEYLKKLYKILAPKDEKDPLSIFAKYAAGELPAAALKSFVRQAQADRKAKKSGEDMVNGHRWRVSLKPELGGGVVEVIAADPIDAKKKAIQQTPDWRFVDAAALTVTRLDEPAAGASTTASHPEGRGRPNDPTGRYAITQRDDQRNYGNHVGSEAPDYQFRFTLPDGYSQAQMRSVLSAWAARNAVNAEDYMIVDTTQFAAPASAAPAGSGSVQWNIIDNDGNVVHTFWNTNVQADANAAAFAWIRRQPGLGAGSGPWDVVPITNSTASSEPIPGSTLDLQRQRQRDAALAAASMAADAAPSARQLQQMAMSNVTNPPYYPPPTPIPGVEDIDIDIPMAQTQWEVYDRIQNRPVMFMYAQTQAEAWRKGQEWVAAAQQANPRLDAANFSVRPRSVNESREITKLGKLDSVLERCIGMIHRGQETNPEKYGRVAACLIDNKNNHTYAINMPGPDGTRRHAERMAIDKHLESHGRIGPNAIMITTLSPCVRHMDERHGESCTDLLSDYGIEKCYAGWQDPTQHPATDYPFNLQITNNADIFNTCKDIAASFLPQTVAEGTEQITWIKPNFDYEWHEVEDQSKMEQVPQDVRQYYQKHFPNKDAWIRAVQHGRAVVLQPDHQAVIRNAPVDKESLLQVLAPTSHEGPIGPAKKKRVDALFAKGGPIEMPIVLKTSKGLWLIGGKTRLGTANYIKGIPAKVWVIGGKKDMDENFADGRNPGNQIRDKLNAWMDQDQSMNADPTKRTGLQSHVWTYIQKNINSILSDKGADGKGSYPAAPYAAWLLVQHMDATPNNQSKFASQLEQAGLDPTDGKNGEGKLQFIKDRAAVNQWILKLNDTEKYLDKHGKPLTNPTADVRDPSKFDDAGIEYTSADDALDGAIAAGNTLLVDAVKKSQATTQPSYKQSANENFADGRHPEDKGDSKRLGVPTKSSVSNLRKYAKSHSGRAAQLAHWAANMKAGRAKTNEATVATINIGDITVVLDDHVLDRQQQRGIDDKSLDAAIRKLKFPRVIKQMDQIEAGNRFYVMDHTTNVSLGIRKLSDKRYQLKTVFNGRPADHNIAGIITV